MKLLLLVALATVASAAEKPADPIWPDVFTQEFKEKFYYPVLGTHYTTGKFYYDFPNRRYRVDRVNGRYDRYCGINGIKAFQNTACTHLVVDGVRWLVYPEKQECCRCCSSIGCQILMPTWLTGAKYNGQAVYKDYKGQDHQSFAWDQPGLQSNIYRETVANSTGDRVMLEIDQQPNDTQYFDPASRKLSVDESVFALPSYCSESTKCSLFSACRAVGDN